MEWPWSEKKEPEELSNIVLFNDVSPSLLGGGAPSKITGVRSGEEFQRVNPFQMEILVRREPVIANAVNIYEEVIVASDPFIVCEGDDCKETMAKFWERTNFLGEVIPNMVRQMVVHGNSWNEIVPNKAHDNVVKLDLRDPKYMDYSRYEQSRTIKFDKFGIPQYYVQYLRSDLERRHFNKRGLINQLGYPAIKYEIDQILNARLYTVGDNYDGVGLVESVYNTTISKINMQDVMSQSYLNMGFPLMGLEVGTDTVFPNKQMIDEAAEIMKNKNERTGFAYPHWVKPHIFEPKTSERMKNQLEYFIDQIISGLGVPKALVTGIGEQENKQTLKEQKEVFRLRIKSIEQKISRAVEIQVFSQIAAWNGWDEIPRLVWREPEASSMEDKALRITEYVKAGLLTPDEEIEKLIRKMENLPEKK